MSKRLLSVFALIFLAVTGLALFWPSIAGAQTLLPVAGSGTPTLNEWAQFIGSLSGIQNMTISAIIGIAVQGYMLLRRTKLNPLGKLTTVTGLTLGLGTPALALAGGMAWPAAIAQAATLAAAQVYAHQVVKRSGAGDQKKKAA